MRTESATKKRETAKRLNPDFAADMDIGIDVGDDSDLECLWATAFLLKDGAMMVSQDDIDESTDPPTIRRAK